MRSVGRTTADMLTKPAPRSTTDLVASQPLLDAKNRIGLGKLTRCLNVGPGDAVVAVLDGATVRVTAADAPRRTGFPVPMSLDAQQRLTLTPALCHTLGVSTGQQVQAIADPMTGELTLMSLEAALAHLLDATDKLAPAHHVSTTEAVA